MSNINKQELTERQLSILQGISDGEEYTTVFELHDEVDMLAKIEMFDEGASNLTVKTVVAPDNWPELSAAIYAALMLMHPAKGETS